MKLIYESAKSASAYSQEDFPKIADCIFKYYPPALDEDGRLVGPPMVRVMRDWTGHRLDGEVLGDVVVA